MGTQWRMRVRENTWKSELLHSWNGHSHPPTSLEKSIQILQNAAFPCYINYSLTQRKNGEKNLLIHFARQIQFWFWALIQNCFSKRKKQNLISLRSTVPETEVQQLIKRVKHHDRGGLQQCKAGSAQGLLLIQHSRSIDSIIGTIRSF